MSRLPMPGSDSGQWGSILNDFLTTSLTTDGALKPGTVGDDQVTALSPAKITGLSATIATTTARVFYNMVNSAYPARPSGFTSVEWIGPVAPTIGGPGNAVDGYDTWINTA